jgi:hypothetical protein
MSEVVTPVEREQLVPLDQISLRQEAMARCIGPITVLDTLHALDNARAEEGEFSVKVLSYTNNMSVLYRPKLLVTLANNLRDTLGYQSNISNSEVQDGLTTTQKRLLERFTFNKTLPAIMRESVRDTGMILDRWALPGYLAVKNEYHTDDPRQAYQARTHYETVALSHLFSALRADDFKKIMRSMSFSANGAYGSMSGPDQDVFKRISSELKGRVDADIIQPICLYNVCEKKPNGEITLSTPVIRLLRAYLKDENRLADQYQDSTSGSIGCPASMKDAKVHIDDFTEEQWELLTKGENPIAHYDKPKQKLTILRKPIDELLDEFANMIELIDR